jgi:hypothetical protein
MAQQRFNSLMAAGVLAALVGSPGAVLAGGPNNCPVASPLIISTANGMPVNSQLIATDMDGDPLTYAVVAPPVHGVVVLQTMTGAFAYTPAAGYCGPDSFKFTASDGMCTSNQATVAIAVSCAPAPTATPTSTPTATPTSTPTVTPRAIGETCASGSQCASTFCADGVCCDTACQGLGQQCDQPGQIGTCATAAPAPAMSWAALLAGLGLVSSIAALQLRRRRRTPPG